MPIRLDRDTELIRWGVDPVAGPLTKFLDFASAKMWVQQFRPDGLAMLKLRAMLCADLPAAAGLSDSEVIDRVAWYLADGRLLVKQYGQAGPVSPQAAAAVGTRKASLKWSCNQAYAMSFDCSDLVWHVWKDLVNPKEKKRDANHLIDFLIKEANRGGSGWTEVSMGKAAELANSDVFVVAGAKKSPHGHVVVIYPGSQKPDGGFRFTRDGKSLIAPRHGTYPRCVSRSSGSWPGANSPGDKTVRDPWTEPEFKQVKFWAYQPHVRAGESGAEGGGPKYPGETPPPGFDPDLPPVKPPVPDQPKTWIEVCLVDMEGNPVRGAKYILKDSGGSHIAEGTLSAAGCARVDGLDPGNYDVTFPEYDRDVWERV